MNELVKESENVLHKANNYENLILSFILFLVKI